LKTFPDHDGLLIDADALCTELRRRGDDWADKDAAFRALEDVQKSIFSQAILATDARAPVTIREAQARASELYMGHLRAMDEARQAANRSRVAYDVYRINVDLKRTNASAQRTLAGIL